MKENKTQHEAMDQETDDTFLCIYVGHTLAWHLPYVHLKHGWALKVGTQVSEHGITWHSYA